MARNFMNRIQELESKINTARSNYYNGQSTVSDKIFDAWIDELNQLDPKNIAVTAIGSDPVSNWEKYTHLTPMGSLNKVQTYDEYVKWHNKYISDKDKILLTLKLDGLSVSLIYENGILAKAASRGSGIIGELLTANVAKMLNVPLKLSQKINATIRGEILLSKKNHQKFFKEYSNPRNAASGISRRYDGTGSEHLSVLTYQLFSDDLNFDTQEEQFIILQNLGFTVPMFYVLSSLQDVLDLKNKYQEFLRDQCEFELDGLVIHQNDLAKHTAFGSNHDRPYSSIAFKFDSIAKEGFIKEIAIQVGNSGRVTPVAIFDPKIELMGAMIERASLHNFANIRNLGIDVGATVLVCRSNDVIPFIEEVVQSTNTVFKTPTHCPKCNSTLLEKGEYIQCVNYECPSQIFGRILNWVNELNLLEWGGALIQRLVESKKVTTVADLYKLSIDDLASIDRMGNKSAQKCYDLLWSNSEISLEVFLGGLSIPFIGQSTIKLIMDTGCDTLEQFYKLQENDFEQVPGVGPVKARSLFNGLRNNQQLISEILKNNVKIKTRTIGILTNKFVCFTGAMQNKRPVLEKMASDAGATVKNTVGKNLNYLIIRDVNSTSSKAVSARKFGTILLSEEEFLQIINNL